MDPQPTPTTGTRAAKNELFEALTSVARALSSGRRAEIIELLAQGERPVEQVAEAIGQSVANTSHHLRTLAGAGLLTSRREGTYVYYRLASRRVVDLWRAVREVSTAHLERIDDLAATYLGNRDELQTITRDELADRLRAGDVVLLDVRPEPEYRAGHIAAARSVPVMEVTRRLDELPAGVDVVAYCRGPYCVYADEAVRTLTRAGRPARRLEDGYPEWEDAGLPVESGDRKP
ncbi:MAG: metalloregulator ArsR/SmtB family transcription factor [Actinomycetota bacterium]|nr:metalloregulator ArsR/SmtB family transcription factor [Actinomycetota bacterium]